MRVIRFVLPFATSFSWWASMPTILFLLPALAGLLRPIEKPAEAGSEERIVVSDATS
jgi:hypothetical protein